MCHSEAKIKAAVRHLLNDGQSATEVLSAVERWTSEIIGEQP